MIMLRSSSAVEQSTVSAYFDGIIYVCQTKENMQIEEKH